MSNKQTMGLTPRLLYVGLNKILDESLARLYIDPYEKLFPVVKHDRQRYEIEMLTGDGVPAGLRDESADLQYFTTINQVWNYQPTILTYEKSARITLEAQVYNLYEKLLPRLGEEIAKAHKLRRALECVSIFNNASTASVTYGDGKPLCDHSHPLSTTTAVNDNLITSDFDEDAIEQMKIMIKKFKNEDGQVGDYEPDQLIYPTDLTFEVERMAKSTGRINTAYNDTNVQKGISGLEWKRLDSTTNFFMLSNSSNRFMIAESFPIQMKKFSDNWTWDDLATAVQMFTPVVLDSSRSLVGSL